MSDSLHTTEIEDEIEVEELRAEVERLRDNNLAVSEDLAKAGAEIERMKKPITMQDVRLYAGEGKLSAATILQAVNAILARRSIK